MSIPIEGFLVVIQMGPLSELLERETIYQPNATVIEDGDLWKCSFMTASDARSFMSELEKKGLNLSAGPNSDGVLVSEFDRSVDPYCEWLELATYKKSVIGWKIGTRPERIVARKGWDPEVGSGLTMQPNETEKDNLEFVRLDGNVEVYQDKETGEEVYVGRTSTPVEALFKSAAAILEKYFIHSGQQSVVGDDAAEVQKAIAMLEKAKSQSPDAWQIHFYLGKGFQSLGRDENSYAAFAQAFALESEQEIILRELAGACLALGKFDEAATVGEKAVAIEPDNSELIGNLALAYLMAKRVDEAMKSIEVALKLNPEDRINRNIRKVVVAVAEGRRPQPESLASLHG